MHAEKKVAFFPTQPRGRAHERRASAAFIRGSSFLKNTFSATGPTYTTGAVSWDTPLDIPFKPLGEMKLEDLRPRRLNRRKASQMSRTSLGMIDSPSPDLAEENTRKPLVQRRRKIGRDMSSFALRDKLRAATTRVKLAKFGRPLSDITASVMIDQPDEFLPPPPAPSPPPEVPLSAEPPVSFTRPTVPRLDVSSTNTLRVADAVMLETAGDIAPLPEPNRPARTDGLPTLQEITKRTGTIHRLLATNRDTVFDSVRQYETARASLDTAVDSLTARLRTQLQKRDDERADTYRLKLSCLTVRPFGPGFATDMATMRIKARVQHLQERIDWLKEGGFYSEMIQLVTAGGRHEISKAERFLVTYIKKMIEEGRLVSKHLLFHLLDLCQSEDFEDPGFQRLLEFLRCKLHISKSELESFLFEHGFPIPSQMAKVQEQSPVVTSVSGYRSQALPEHDIV